MSTEGPSKGRRIRRFLKNWNDKTLIYICLLLAAAAGILMTGLGLYRNHQHETAAAREAEIHKDWAENLIPKEAELIDALLRDVSEERSIVLFKTGTVVLVPEPCEDPKMEAIRLLRETAKPTCVFAVNEVGNDYAVRYEGPVFTRISGKAVSADFERLRKNWRTYLTGDEAEKLEADEKGPDKKVWVGLVARSFMLRDGEEGQVTKILRAKK